MAVLEVYFTHSTFCSNVYLATIDFVPSSFFLHYQGLKLSISYFDLGELFVNFHGDLQTCCRGKAALLCMVFSSSSRVWVVFFSGPDFKEILRKKLRLS